MLIVTVFVMAVVAAVALGWDAFRRRGQRRGRWWDWESFAASGAILGVVTIWDAVTIGWTAAITAAFAVAYFTMALISARQRWTGPFRDRRTRD